jgi:preprotein translocase subunit YajC
MNFLMLLAETTENSSPASSLLTMMLPLGLFILVFYFFLIRPENKRKKKAAEMLGNIQIADEVVTSGGIIGRVIDVKPDSDTIVIETGGDKTRIRVLKAYIIENRTIHE